MDSTISIAATLFVAGLVYYLAQAIYSCLRGPLASLPGPWYSKWTNLPLKLACLSGQRVHYVYNLHKSFGPFIRISPTEVAVAGLSETKEVHRMGAGYLKHSWYEKNVPGEGRLNIFTIPTNKEHAVRRKLYAQTMSEKANALYEERVSRLVRLTMQRLQEDVQANGHVDVLKWLKFMSADATGDLMFGSTFRMLETGQKSQFAEDVDNNNVLLGMGYELPYLISLFSYIPLPIVQRIVSSGPRQMENAKIAMDRYISNYQNDPKGTKPTCMVQAIEAYEAGNLSRAVLHHDASGMIIAGSDTTANTITYLIWALARRPEMQQRLTQEVATLPANFTDEHVKRLKYMTQVIDETLRLYGAAPGALPRVVPSGGKTLGGHFLREGLTVTTHAFPLHRDPSIYLEPEKFDPDRWANPTQEMKEAFMPFGAGARICGGIPLARMEIRLSVAHLYRTFPAGFMIADGVEGMSDADMDMLNYFLVLPKGGRCLVKPL